jgi:hypothetical protein
VRNTAQGFHFHDPRSTMARVAETAHSYNTTQYDEDEHLILNFPLTFWIGNKARLCSHITGRVRSSFLPPGTFDSSHTNSAMSQKARRRRILWRSYLDSLNLTRREEQRTRRRHPLETWAWQTVCIASPIGYITKRTFMAPFATSLYPFIISILLGIGKRAPIPWLVGRRRGWEGRSLSQSFILTLSLACL